MSHCDIDIHVYVLFCVLKLYLHLLKLSVVSTFVLYRTHTAHVIRL